MRRKNFNRELSGGDDYKTAAHTVNARLKICLQFLPATRSLSFITPAFKAGASRALCG
jgi:hypothetical protein